MDANLQLHARGRVTIEDRFCKRGRDLIGKTTLAQALRGNAHRGHKDVMLFDRGFLEPTRIGGSYADEPAVAQPAKVDSATYAWDNREPGEMRYGCFMP
jgi:hypothetical protein